MKTNYVNLFERDVYLDGDFSDFPSTVLNVEKEPVAILQSKTIYELKNVTKIYIKNEELIKWFEWKPFKKRLFWKDYEEGFYEGDYDYFYSNEEILKSGDKIIRERHVYQKPYVNVSFNGHNVTQIFDSFQEALKYGEDLAKKHITLQLIIES